MGFIFSFSFSFSFRLCTLLSLFVALKAVVATSLISPFFATFFVVLCARAVFATQLVTTMAHSFAFITMRGTATIVVERRRAATIVVEQRGAATIVVERRRGAATSSSLARILLNHGRRSWSFLGCLFSFSFSFSLSFFFSFSFSFSFSFI